MDIAKRAARNCKPDTESRLAALVEEILEIADGVTDKGATAAKLQIDARKWVVETVLLKDAAKEKGEGGPAPMAVNIHTGESQWHEG